MMNEKNMLFGDKLLSYNNAFAPDTPLEYSDESDTIGIATEDSTGTILYYVYQKGERGSLDWKKEFPDFQSALEYAKMMYSGMISYFNGMYDTVRTSENREIYVQSEIVPQTDSEERMSSVMQTLEAINAKLDQIIKDQQTMEANIASIRNKSRAGRKAVRHRKRISELNRYSES